MQITLVDLHGLLDAAVKTQGWHEVQSLPWTNIKDIEIVPNSAYVSPANSKGYMDGGIDYVLSRVIFPGIENKVKKAILAGGEQSLLGMPVLSIGKAVCIPTQHNNVFLIAAPTMWHPQDVTMTHNAYHAMYAILSEAKKNENIKRIILCGLCTGYGKMTPENAIHQMMMAYRDFVQGNPPQWSLEDIVIEQPLWYENTEFKYISPYDVKYA